MQRDIHIKKTHWNRKNILQSIITAPYQFRFTFFPSAIASSMVSGILSALVSGNWKPKRREKGMRLLLPNFCCVYNFLVNHNFTVWKIMNLSLFRFYVKKFEAMRYRKIFTLKFVLSMHRSMRIFLPLDFTGGSQLRLICEGQKLPFFQFERFWIC